MDGGRGFGKKVQQNLKIKPGAQTLLSILSLATNKTMGEVVELALYEYAANHANEIREHLRKVSEDALGTFDRLLRGDANVY